MDCSYSLKLDKEYTFETKEDLDKFIQSNYGLVQKYVDIATRQKQNIKTINFGEDINVIKKDLIEFYKTVNNKILNDFANKYPELNDLFLIEFNKKGTPAKKLYQLEEFFKANNVDIITQNTIKEYVIKRPTVFNFETDNLADLFYPSQFVNPNFEIYEGYEKTLKNQDTLISFYEFGNKLLNDNNENKSFFDTFDEYGVANNIGNSKIDNVNYEISEEARATYRRSFSETMEQILGNKRILLFQPNERYKSVPISQFKNFAGISEYYNIPDSNNGGLYGNNTEELFNTLRSGVGVKRNLLLQMGLRIAERFTNETDKFTGRLQSTVSENQSIRIVDELNSPILFHDGNGIYINIAKLDKLVDSFENYEAFIKGVDLIFTEELIHGVFRKIATAKEILDVYKELSVGQKNKIKSIYNNIDDSTDKGKLSLVNEYLRMLVQDVMLGTTTEYELKPAIRNLITKFLNFIKKAFAKSPDLKANKLVDRFEYFYKNGEVPFENPLEDRALQKLLKKLNLGVGLENNLLTEQQRQNIQELKQLEPEYAVASDEKVQEFIGKFNAQYEKVFTLTNDESNFFDTFDSTSDFPNNNTESVIETTQEIADYLAKKFGIGYKFVNEPNVDWRGKFQDDVVYLNKAHLSTTTVWHEYSHSLVRAVRKSNEKLFANLKNQINNSFHGNKIKNVLVEKYPELTPNTDSFYEEAIVIAISDYIANKIDANKNKSLFGKLKEFLKDMSIKLREIFKFNNIDLTKLDKDITIKDLAGIMMFGGKVLTSEYIEHYEKNIANNDVNETNKMFDSFINHTLIKRKNPFTKAIEKLENSIDQNFYNKFSPASLIISSIYHKTKTPFTLEKKEVEEILNLFAKYIDIDKVYNNLDDIEKTNFLKYLKSYGNKKTNLYSRSQVRNVLTVKDLQDLGEQGVYHGLGAFSGKGFNTLLGFWDNAFDKGKTIDISTFSSPNIESREAFPDGNTFDLMISFDENAPLKYVDYQDNYSIFAEIDGKDSKYPTFRYSTLDFVTPDKAIERIKNRNDSKYLKIRPHTEYFLEANLENVKELIVYNSMSEDKFNEVKLFAKKWGIPVKVVGNGLIKYFSKEYAVENKETIINLINSYFPKLLPNNLQTSLSYYIQNQFETGEDLGYNLVNYLQESVAIELETIINSEARGNFISQAKKNNLEDIDMVLSHVRKRITKEINDLGNLSYDMSNSLTGEEIKKQPYQPRVKYSKLSKQESLSKLPETKLDKYNKIFEEHIEQLKSKFPNITVNIVFENSNKLGWVKNGEVNLNKNKFTLATPIHEFAHIYLAILKDSDFTKYKEIIDSVEDTKEFKQLALIYPELNKNDLLEETFVYLLGESNANRLVKENEDDYNKSILAQVGKKIKSFLKEIADLLGLSSLLNLQNYDKYITQITNELLDSSTPITMTSSELSDIMKDVKEQKTTVVGNVNDLLKFVTGKSLTVSDNTIRHHIGNIFTTYADKDYFYLTKEDEKSGAKKQSFGGITDETDRKKTIEFALKAKYEEDKNKDINELITFFKLPLEEREALINSTNKEESYYFTIASKLFGNFKDGDKVIKYSELENLYPEMYSKELDNDNTLINVWKNGKNFDVVTITNLGVRNADKNETLFNGLYGKATLSASSGITMSNSNEDINSIQATLIAMNITKNKGKVNRVAVGKFDKKKSNNTPVFIDTVRQLKALKYFRKINAVNEQLAQTKTLKDLLLDTPEDNEIFNPTKYQPSYLEVLKETYEGFNTEEYTYPKQLGENIDKYLASPKDFTNIENIRLPIKKRLEFLSRNFNITDLKKNDEFILLSEVLRSLDSGYEHTLNAHKNLGSVERWYTSFVSISNKYISWWLRGFESRRFNLTEKWLKDYKGYDGKEPTKNGMIDVFNKLIKDYELRNPQAVVTSRVLNDTTKYFENLFMYKEVNYTDKNGKTEKVKINTFRLKDETAKPSDTKYLSKVERETITYIKAHIKKSLIDNYRSNNFKPDDKSADEWEESIETWYKKTSFAEGAIPIIKSTISSKLFKVGETSLSGVVSKKLLDNFVNINPYYESNPEDFSKLPDYFGYQSQIDRYNEKIGFNSEGDFLVDDYASLQSDVETDLIKALDIFTLQVYKQEFMKDLVPMWKAATVMINKADIDVGIKQLGEDDIKSNAEDILDKIVKSLVFNQKITAKTAGEQKLAKFIDTITTATTFGTVALAPFTSLKSFLSNVLGLVTNAIKNANNGYDVKYTLQDLYWAFGKLTKEFDKAVMMATELRVLNPDEFDMISSLQYSSHKFSLLRSVNAFILDLGADRFIKLMILIAQSKKDKTWYAWEWNKGKLEYNEEVDRKTRGTKIVDEIKLNQQKEGSLHPNAKMKSPYDSVSRLTYEKLNAMVLGGYTDLTATYASTTMVGKLFSQMRKYMFARAEKAFRDEDYNDNEVYYKEGKDGEVVKITPYENGQYKSFVRMASMFYNKYANLTSEEMSNLSQSDKENLKSMLVFTISAVSFMVLQSVSEGEDKDKKVRSVYDSLISDMFIIDNAKTTIDAFKNPFISISLISKMMDVTKDLVVGDLKQANNKLFKTIGVLKTYDFFTTLGK